MLATRWRNMLLICLFGGFTALLHSLVGFLMCGLKTGGMAIEHIRKKRARLPQDDEKDFHECVEFESFMKYVQPDEDQHLVAVRPYIPVQVADDPDQSRGQILEESEDDFELE